MPDLKIFLAGKKLCISFAVKYNRKAREGIRKVCKARIISQAAGPASTVAFSAHHNLLSARLHGHL